MLNLRTIFNGLNNMAIDNDGITIKISVDYDPVTGDPINTRWDISDADMVNVPDYIAGVMRDNETMPAKFFDASGKFPRYIMERRPKTYEAKTTRERKYSKSAFQRMMDAINLAIPLLQEEHISILTDLEKTKELTGVGIPFMIEVNTSIDIEQAFQQQTYFAKKNRYFRRPIEILGKKYWITNHIFDRNIPKIKTMLTNMIGIEYMPDESEIDDAKEKAMNIIMSMVAEGKLPKDFLTDPSNPDNIDDSVSIENDDEIDEDDSIIVQ